MHTRHPATENSPLRVEIHTEMHLILGALQFATRRLANLRDRLASPHLLVKDARIQPLQYAHGQRYLQAEHLLVSRDDIRVCIPYGFSAVPCQGETDAAKPPRHSVPVSLDLRALKIDGQVCAEEGVGAFESAQNESGLFLVVLQARIRYMDEAISLPFTADTLLVNKAHIHTVVPRHDADRPVPA